MGQTNKGLEKWLWSSATKKGVHSKKIQVQLRNEKYLVKYLWLRYQRKLFKKISDDDDGGFQQQRPQRLIDEYEHMNSQNDSLMMRLKAIEAEYYSIEN